MQEDLPHINFQKYEKAIFNKYLENKGQTDSKIDQALMEKHTASKSPFIRQKS